MVARHVQFYSRESARRLFLSPTGRVKSSDAATSCANNADGRASVPSRVADLGEDHSLATVTKKNLAAIVAQRIGCSTSADRCSLPCDGSDSGRQRPDRGTWIRLRAGTGGLLPSTSGGETVSKECLCAFRTLLTLQSRADGSVSDKSRLIDGSGAEGVRRRPRRDLHRRR